MTDFFDWLSAADSGAGADRLAQQFKISPREMRETTDALVPAFMLGIQRAMTDPAAWTQLTRGLGASAPNGVSSALPSTQAGEAVMRALFGTELVHAIARQASLLTGQAPDVIEKMMPALGALTVRSMMQMMTAISAGNPHAYPTDPAGHALAEAMRRSANAVEAFSRPVGAPRAAPPMADIFAEALKGGFPWMGTLPGAIPSDPFAFFSTMMTAFSKEAPADGAARRPEDTRKPDAGQGAPAAAPPFVGMMAGAGTLQADYVREMMALFERHGRT